MKASLTVLLLVAATVLIGVPTAYGNNCQRCLAYNYNNYNACGYFCKRRLSETDEDETLALDEDEMVFTKSRRLNYQCQLCKVRNPGYHSACSWVC